ncbi:MAG: Pup--protein ligase [Actinomycetes bacterium]
MHRRIFGLETEYGITYSFNGQRRLSPDDVSRVLFRKVVAWGRSSNVFLENGSRLYLDVGSHPEYATAECDNLYDLVAQDGAGERILQSLVTSAQQQLSDEGSNGSIFLFRNNTDSAGNSYGCHENYCTEREEDLGRHEQFFIPFLVSRQIWSGAGKVVTTASRGTHFGLSQRAEHIWESISSATTRSRPIINTRDEPHADPEKYRRLHVIVGDSNMSEFATFVKVGASCLILSMIEDRHTILRDLTLEQPIKAFREISMDPFGDGHCKVRLANGREMTALELQEEICERVEAYVVKREIPSDQLEALRLWRGVLTQLRLDPMVLADRLDWVAKYRLIEALRTREQLPLTDPKIQLLDLLYHDTDPQRGLYHRLAAKGNLIRMVDESVVQSAVTQAPETTRARMRGAFVRRAKEKNRDFTVDWVHLKLNDQVQRTVLLKDPFKSHDDRFERLLNSL